MVHSNWKSGIGVQCAAPVHPEPFHGCPTGPCFGEFSLMMETDSGSARSERAGRQAGPRSSGSSDEIAERAISIVSVAGAPSRWIPDPTLDLETNCSAQPAQVPCTLPSRACLEIAHPPILCAKSRLLPRFDLIQRNQHQSQIADPDQHAKQLCLIP